MTGKERYIAQVIWRLSSSYCGDSGLRVKTDTFKTLEESREFIKKHKNLTNASKAYIYELVYVNEEHTGYKYGKLIEHYIIKRKGEKL